MAKYKNNNIERIQEVFAEWQHLPEPRLPFRALLAKRARNDLVFLLTYPQHCDDLPQEIRHALRHNGERSIGPMTLQRCMPLITERYLRLTHPPDFTDFLAEIIAKCATESDLHRFLDLSEVRK